MWMGEEVSLLANADMHRNTGDEGYQLLVGRDANTKMPFLLPPWRHKSPVRSNQPLKTNISLFSIPLQELSGVSEPE
jgi:hypothetical protein